MRSTLLLLTAVIASTTAVETGSPINDLRLSVGVAMAPSVDEHITTAAGASSDVEWDDMKRVNLRYAVEYVNGADLRRIGQAGIVWSAGVQYSDLDLTPGVYRTGGTERLNTRSDLELHSKQYWGVGSFGWAARPKYTEFGDWHWEAALVGRGGPTQDQTQGYDFFGNAVRRDSLGFGWEAGDRKSVV